LTQAYTFSKHPGSATLLSIICILSSSLSAQPLLSEANDPNAPVYIEVRPQPTSQLRATLERMQALLAELRQKQLAPAQQQAELDELIRDHNQILRQHNTWLDWQKPQTVDSAALLLEKMIFEIAAEDIAPTEESREQVLRNAPAHLELDPQEPEVYAPPLLKPMERNKGQAPPEQSTGATAAAAEPAEPEVTQTAAKTTPAPVISEEREVSADQKTVSVSQDAQVAVLADNATTVSMQDDNSVLREVRNKKGELVLFGKVRLWLGGAVQLDAYAGKGLFTLAGGGNSDSKTYVRRAEGILRASVLKNAEIKVQYDFDANIFRNLYWRWLSDSASRSLTVGNQKEPIGLDYLVGSKFTTAMEPSAPSSAFASYRSAGVRYSSWGALESEDRPLQLWGDNRTYMTSSIGLFGKDLENSNDTDRAVTGRVTMGARPTEDVGYHLGISASYRHGDYDRIAPRPGLHDVDRITLAQPDADTQALVGLEGLAGLGSLHGEMELYYSDYSGGDVDAEGWGGYGQVGWMFGGKQRTYQPRWGVWAPIHAGDEHIFEVFGRVSYTHGNDNVNSSNDLSLLTLGGTWYYRNFRVSANVILADTKRDISDEGSGQAIGLRLQYLF
jgi:phosphate-selective porin OprO/OprP